MEPWKLENGVPSGEIEFNRGAKAAKVARNTCAVYGDNDIGESTERKLFSRFKKDRYAISDTPRSGRLSGFDEDRLKTLIHNYPRQCSRELINMMNCEHFTILRHLYSMCKVQKSGVGLWVPHVLSQNHKISGCLMSKQSSLKRENHFLSVLSPMALSPYSAQMFLAAPAAFALLLNSKRRICRKCSNFSIGAPFSSVYGTTRYLQLTKLQYVNSSITIELQIKNDNPQINP